MSTQKQPDSSLVLNFKDKPSYNNNNTRQIDIMTHQSIHKFKSIVSINNNFLNGLLTGSQICTKVKEAHRPNLIYTTEKLYNKFGFSFNLLKQNVYELSIQFDIFMKMTNRKYSKSHLSIYYQFQSKWKIISQQNVNDKNNQFNVAFFKINDIYKLIKESHIFLVFEMEWKSFDPNGKPPIFCGLKNVGNSCYMNSYLQSLFFIKQFRKIILKIQDQKDNQLLNALQLCFFNMMNTEGKEVNPRDIFKSERLKNFQYLQQDLGQFKNFLFEQLSKYSQLEKMFKYEIKTIIKDKENKNYNSQVTQISFELNLEVIKNNKKMNLIQSIKSQLQEEQLIHKTQEFGPILVTKRLIYSKLPDVMVINFKRYEYNSLGSQKLTSKCQFQKQINVGFLLNDVSEIKYTLYAIIVHEGHQVNVGHYYSYINVSNNCQKYQWFKFNDSKVEKAEEQEAIDRNFGGVQNIFVFNQDKFYQKTVKKDKTAYMLMYIRTSQFNRIQEQQLFLIPSRFRQAIEIKKNEEIYKSIPIASAKKSSKVIKLKKIDIVLDQNLSSKVSSIFSDQCLKYKLQSINIDLHSGFCHQIMEASKKIFINQTQLFQLFVWRISRKHKTVFNLKKIYNDKQITAKYMLYGDNDNQDQSIYILFSKNRYDGIDIIQEQKQKDGKISLVQISKLSNQKLIFQKIGVVQTQLLQNILKNKLLPNQHIVKKQRQKFKLIELDQINPYNKCFHCIIVQNENNVNLTKINWEQLMN